MATDSPLPATTADPGRGLRIAIRSVSIALAALFLFAGLLGKLINSGDAMEMFAGFGYPGWLALFIGACETAGAVGLLIPRLATLAAGGLSIIMAGATFSHVRSGDPLAAVLFPLVVIVLLAFVAVVRLGDLRGSRA